MAEGPTVTGQRAQQTTGPYFQSARVGRGEPNATGVTRAPAPMRQARAEATQKATMARAGYGTSKAGGFGPEPQRQGGKNSIMGQVRKQNTQEVSRARKEAKQDRYEERLKNQPGYHPNARA